MDRLIAAAKELVAELNKTGGHYERLDRCKTELDDAVREVEANQLEAEPEPEEVPPTSIPAPVPVPKVVPLVGSKDN